MWYISVNIQYPQNYLHVYYTFNVPTTNVKIKVIISELKFQGFLQYTKNGRNIKVLHMAMYQIWLSTRICRRPYIV